MEYKLFDAIIAELSRRDLANMTLEEIAKVAQIYGNITARIELNAAIAGMHASFDGQASGVMGIGLLPSLTSLNEALEKG